MFESGQHQRHGKCSSAPFLMPTMLLAALAGCASTGDRPDRELTTAEVIIEQARQSGAAQYGPDELAAAQAKLAEARAAVDRDDMQAAERLAEQAALDAQLATAMARDRKAEAAVDELNRSIDTLREEIARNQSKTGEL